MTEGAPDIGNDTPHWSEGCVRYFSGLGQSHSIDSNSSADYEGNFHCCDWAAMADHANPGAHQRETEHFENRKYALGVDVLPEEDEADRNSHQRLRNSEGRK